MISRHHSVIKFRRSFPLKCQKKFTRCAKPRATQKSPCKAHGSQRACTLQQRIETDQILTRQRKRKPQPRCHTGVARCILLRVASNVGDAKCINAQSETLFRRGASHNPETQKTAASKAAKSKTAARTWPEGYGQIWA